MRRLLLPILILVATAILGACSSSAAPGWTYAPVSASPAASGAASGAPSGSAPASSGPSASAVAPSASAAESAPASGGTSLTVTAPVGAATSGFDPTTLEATANTPFGLIFDNKDNQAPHNLVLQKPDGSAVALQGDTAFFTGPGTRTYRVPALPAGDYNYMCQVHPTTMKGVLTVK